MKAILKKNQPQNQIQILLVGEHTYGMNSEALKGILKSAREMIKTKKQTMIYAVTKGNVTQLVEEPYSNVLALKKAITRYKCKGFHKVHYYLAV